MPSTDTIPFLRYNASNRFLLIAGPCVVENRDTTFEIARTIQDLTEKFQIPFIFKASYRKANRSRLDSFTGIGDIQALTILKEIQEALHVPLLTDVHSPEEVLLAASYVDILQIPAFLCRQTNLLTKAGESGKWINIKKGQFLSPEAMQFAVEKVQATGNHQVLITERGTTFGYQDLVVDFRGVPTMQAFSPVILDCTHSLQRPNQTSGVTGGQPRLIATLAKAGIAAGVDGLFIETHPFPEKALSDGANMLPITELESLLEKTIAIKEALS